MTNFKIFQTILALSALTTLVVGLLVLRHKLYRYGRY